MARTGNSYIPDAPYIKVTISAQNVTDHAELTAAEDLIIGLALQQVAPTRPEKTAVKVMVAGDDSPIVLNSSKRRDSDKLTLTLVDDYFLGETGELGATPYLTVWELFNAFYKSGKAIGGLIYSPAGGSTGMIGVSYTNPIVTQCTMPEANATTSNNASTFTVTIEAVTATAAVLA